MSVINFNQFRKQKNRQQKQQTATQNRTKYGRTKTQKKSDGWRAEKLKKHLDAHKIDSTDSFVD